jgi:hypothetical protein
MTGYWMPRYMPRLVFSKTKILQHPVTTGYWMPKHFLRLLFALKTQSLGPTGCWILRLYVALKNAIS